MLSTHWVKRSAFGNSYILLSMCYVEIDCILILIFFVLFCFVCVLFVLVSNLLNSDTCSLNIYNNLVKVKMGKYVL